MDHVRIPKIPRSKELDKEHKVAFAILLFLGLGGVILGFLSFGASIERPIRLQLANYAKDAGVFLTLSQKEEKEVERMKTRDTDGDGLSDYDEVYVFKTSAYLADSDSDSVDDKTEVFAQENPNCPRGEDCSTAASEKQGKEGGNLAETLFTGPPTGAGTAVALPQGEELDPELLEQSLRELKPEQIRAQLKTLGVDSATLGALSDEELLTLFNEAISQAASADQNAQQNKESL